MKHTFDSYIKNPSGKGSSVLTQKEVYMKLYTEKLDMIMLRENGSVDYRLLKQKDKYYIYIKIYSEVVKGFTYDVIIEYRPADPVIAHAAKNLDNYNVRFFSNDPAFIYTFAYAFNKNDLFITEMANKVPKQSLTDKAKIKNPKSEIGYVKSLYFAYILIKRYKLTEKSKFKEISKTDFDKLKKSIEHASSKIDRRNELGKSVKKATKPTSEPDRPPQTNSSKQSSKIKTTAKTQTTKTTGSIKRSKVVKAK